MHDRINWNKVPVQFAFCARDEMGTVHLFSQQPMQMRFGWAASPNDCHKPLSILGAAYGYKAGSYDWSESMIERN